jgi:hypothetical protein
MTPLLMDLSHFTRRVSCRIMRIHIIQVIQILAATFADDTANWSADDTVYLQAYSPVCEQFRNQNKAFPYYIDARETRGSKTVFLRLKQQLYLAIGLMQLCRFPQSGRTNRFMD